VEWSAERPPAPDDPAEVELQGAEYVLLRERDVRVVTATRVSSDGTGLYL
jgi:chaperonin GroES